VHAKAESNNREDDVIFHVKVAVGQAEVQAVGQVEVLFDVDGSGCRFCIRILCTRAFYALFI